LACDEYVPKLVVGGAAPAAGVAGTLVLGAERYTELEVLKESA
jgi:hypothetical protein